MQSYDYDYRDFYDRNDFLKLFLVKRLIENYQIFVYQQKFSQE